MRHWEQIGLSFNLTFPPESPLRFAAYSWSGLLLSCDKHPIPTPFAKLTCQETFRLGTRTLPAGLPTWQLFVCFVPTHSFNPQVP